MTSNKNFTNFSPKYSCLPLESMELNTEYAITIGPSDGHQYFKSLNRMEDFRNYWRLFVLHNNPKHCHMVLHPEVSSGGRLHFHGTIKFSSRKSLLDFYVRTLPALRDRATYEIDTMSFFKSILLDIDESEEENDTDSETHGSDAPPGVHPWIEYINKQNDYFDWIIDSKKDKCLDIIDNTLVPYIKIQLNDQYEGCDD